MARPWEPRWELPGPVGGHSSAGCRSLLRGQAVWGPQPLTSRGHRLSLDLPAQTASRSVQRSGGCGSEPGWHGGGSPPCPGAPAPLPGQPWAVTGPDSPGAAHGGLFKGGALEPAFSPLWTQTLGFGWKRQLQRWTGEGQTEVRA